MKLTLLFSLFIALTGCYARQASGPVTLSEIVASNDYTGSAILSQGYRGEFRVTARTGVETTIDAPRPVETLEFTHVCFDFRGIGNRQKPALTIVVGTGDQRNTALSGYRYPAVHVKDLPTIDRLKGFTSDGEFERVFGEFRGFTDGWGGGKGGMHTTADWTGFTLKRDGTVRVVSAFLHLLHRGSKTSIEGGSFREGVFKPTGKAPQLEPR